MRSTWSSQRNLCMRLHLPYDIGLCYKVLQFAVRLDPPMSIRSFSWPHVDEGRYGAPSTAGRTWWLRTCSICGNISICKCLRRTECSGDSSCWRLRPTSDRWVNGVSKAVNPNLLSLNIGFPAFPPLWTSLHEPSTSPAYVRCDKFLGDFAAATASCVIHNGRWSCQQLRYLSREIG